MGNIILYITLLCTVFYCNAIDSIVIHWCAGHHTVLQLEQIYNTLQLSVIQYNTEEYSIVQYNTVQYSTIQYNAVKYDTIRFSTVQYLWSHFCTVLTCCHVFVIVQFQQTYLCYNQFQLTHKFKYLSVYNYN